MVAGGVAPPAAEPTERSRGAAPRRERERRPTGDGGVDRPLGLKSRGAAIISALRAFTLR
jgi:hypothetical protein